MIPPVSYTKVPESDRALVARAAEHGLSDLHESLGGVDGRKKKESEVIRALKGGATLFDVFNGEATLKASGIAIKDMTWLEDEKLAD